jgi:hypothetical protein
MTPSLLCCFRCSRRRIELRFARVCESVFVFVLRFAFFVFVADTHFTAPIREIVASG